MKARTRSGPGAKLSLLALWLLNLLAILALYQSRPLYQIRLGSPGDELRIGNFYAAESNEQTTYRWSQARSSFLLPAVGTPYTIEVRATGFRPKELNLPPPKFQLKFDNSDLSQNFQVTPEMAEFGERATFKLERSGQPFFGLEESALYLETETFQPSKTDNRRLGLLVETVSIQARPTKFGVVIPPLRPWFGLSLALLIWQSLLWLLLAARSKKAFWGAAVALTGGACLLFGLFTPFFLENSVSLSLGLILAGVCAYLMLRRTEWAILGSGAAVAASVLAANYGWVSFAAPVTLCAALALLCLVFNPRFEQTRFNLLLVATLAIFSSWGLLQGRVFLTNDGEKFHAFWLNELHLLIGQGLFYPRWAADFTFGHGNAVFNFYAPLTRYLGEIFVLLGLAPAYAQFALLCGISVLSGIGAYFLAREFLGPVGSVVAAAAYLYHPYRLANIYQRGAFAEVVAFAFLPFVLLAVTRLLRLEDKGKLKVMLWGAIAYALLLCSHQLTAFYSLPFLLAPYILSGLGWFLWREGQQSGRAYALKRAGQRFVYVLALGLLGAGLSAFYLLPAFAGSNDIRLSNKVELNSTSVMDFARTTRLWEWVASIGRTSKLDQSADNLAWVGATPLVLAALGLVFAWLPLPKRTGLNRWWATGFGLILAGLLVMQTVNLLPFWQNVPAMGFIQFPWRLMIFVALLAPLLIGNLVENLVANFSGLIPAVSKVKLLPSSGLIVAGVVTLVVAYGGAGRVGLVYYPPEYNGSYTVNELRSEIENADIFYLPNWVRPEGLAEIFGKPQNFEQPWLERNGQRQPDKIGFNRINPLRYELKAGLTAPGTLTIPVFYFDGWKLSANGEKLPISPNQPYGFITTNLPGGNYTLDLRFEDTPIQTFSVVLSLISLLVVLGLFALPFISILNPQNRTREEALLR